MKRAQPEQVDKNCSYFNNINNKKQGGLKMNNTIFLISLVGDGVYAGKSIIGYASSNDKGPIADSIKKYNLTLGEQLMNRFSSQNTWYRS